MKVFICFLLALSSSLGEVPPPYPTRGFRPSQQITSPHRLPFNTARNLPQTIYGVPQVVYGVPNSQPSKQTLTSTNFNNEPQKQYGAPNNYVLQQNLLNIASQPTNRGQSNVDLSSISLSRSNSLYNNPQTSYNTPLNIRTNQNSANNNVRILNPPQTTYGVPEIETFSQLKNSQSKNSAHVPSTQYLPVLEATNFRQGFKTPLENFNDQNNQNTNPQETYQRPNFNQQFNQNWLPQQNVNPYLKQWQSVPSESVNTNFRPGTTRFVQKGYVPPQELSGNGENLTSLRNNHNQNNLPRSNRNSEEERLTYVPPNQRYLNNNAGNLQNEPNLSSSKPSSSYVPPQGNNAQLRTDSTIHNNQKTEVVVERLNVKKLYQPPNNLGQNRPIQPFPSNSKEIPDSREGNERGLDDDQQSSRDNVSDDLDVQGRYIPPSTTSRPTRRPTRRPYVPSTTTTEPSIDDEDSTEADNEPQDGEVNPNVSIATAVAGRLYLLQPDGSLQKVAYQRVKDASDNDSGYIANYHYQTIPALPSPLYALNAPIIAYGK